MHEKRDRTVKKGRRTERHGKERTELARTTISIGHSLRRSLLLSPGGSPLSCAREGTTLAPTGRRPRVLPGPQLAGAAPKKNCVDDRVDQKDERPQCVLEFARERGWVEKRDEVMLDETRGVRRTAALSAEPVLEGRQGADPAGELDPGPPSGSRKVHPGDARPPNDE